MPSRSFCRLLPLLLFVAITRAWTQQPPEPESNLTRDHTQHKSFCAVEHHYRNGMLVQVDDALQQPLQYHYDNTLLIKETFRSGLSFYFEYDGLDHNARCLRTWGDEGIY